MWLYIIGVSSLSKTDGAILREGRKLRDSLRRTLRKMKAHPETKAQALALIDLAIAPSAVQVKGDEPNIVRVRKPRSAS